jgi:hypothetical protein
MDHDTGYLRTPILECINNSAHYYKTQILSQVMFSIHQPSHFSVLASTCKLNEIKTEHENDKPVFNKVLQTKY